MPVLEIDSTGASKYINTFGALGLVSRRTVSSASTTYFAFDERGNTAQRTSSTGTVLSSRLVDAYGKTRYQNAGSTQEAYDGFMARSGYCRHSNTDLYLATFRLYDPTIDVDLLETARAARPRVASAPSFPPLHPLFIFTRYR